MNIEKTVEDIEIALKQAERGMSTGETINEIKYWTGFKGALEWLTTKEKEDGFKDEQ
jgi:hypothetical protein